MINKEKICEIKEFFDNFDKDNDGIITFKEFTAIMRALGLNPTELDIQEIDYMSNPKGIDFGKMKPRSENELVDFNSLNHPAVGYYEPKYESVMKSQIKGVKFDPKQDKKITSPSKQFLVQKLWRSYENQTEYKLVKF